MGVGFRLGLGSGGLVWVSVGLRGWVIHYAYESPHEGCVCVSLETERLGCLPTLWGFALSCCYLYVLATGGL